MADQDVVDVQTSELVEGSIDLQWIRQHLNHAARIIAADTGRQVTGVDVRIVTSGEMAALHQTHKGIDGPTDVLSFDLSDGAAQAVEADIVICADVAARQAAELGHRCERELLLYALHGMLHCAGFDDQAEADFRRMHDAEDRILMQLGVGATFVSHKNAGEAPKGSSA